MKNYQLYKHPFYGSECVKIGFSWPAFFFGIFWILFSRLWLVAFIWFLTYILITFISGSQIVNMVLFMALIAIAFAMWLVPAFEGNNWLGANLKKSGYEFIGVVQASSKTEAIAKANALNIQRESISTEEAELKPELQLGNDLFFANNPNQTSSGAIFSLILAVMVLVVSMLFTKPTDTDFLSYFFNENRLQSEVASQLEPGNPFAAIAVLGDILDFVASGNLNNLKPTVLKKDYRLFVLYSIKTDIKSYKGKFEKFKRFSKKDTSQLIGMNATYIGLWGNFYRLADKPLNDGELVSFNGSGNANEGEINAAENEEDSGVKERVIEAPREHSYLPEPKRDVVITYDQAVSLIQALPQVKEMSKHIIEVSDGSVQPKFYPKHDDYSYESYKGKKYNAISFIENHEEHVVTLNEFLVSLDGEEILVWDLEANDYIPVNANSI